MLLFDFSGILSAARGQSSPVSDRYKNVVCQFPVHGDSGILYRNDKVSSQIGHDRYNTAGGKAQTFQSFFYGFRTAYPFDDDPFTLS
jgi:hypothetical protein